MILKQSEKSIETSILQYLTLNNIFCWKVNNVGIYDSTKKIFRKPKSRFLLPGISDILGVIQGKIFAIEVKRPDKLNTITIEQMEFLLNISSNGGIAILACNAGILNFLKDEDMSKYSKVIVYPNEAIKFRKFLNNKLMKHKESR